MSNIHTLCKKISRVTDADIAGVERIIDQQMTYMHPSKVSVEKTNRTGEKNKLCLAKLRELRDLLNS